MHWNHYRNSSWLLPEATPERNAFLWMHKAISLNFFLHLIPFVLLFCVILLLLFLIVYILQALFPIPTTSTTYSKYNIFGFYAHFDCYLWARFDCWYQILESKSECKAFSKMSLETRIAVTLLQRFVIRFSWRKTADSKLSLTWCLTCRTWYSFFSIIIFYHGTLIMGTFIVFLVH